MATRRFRKRQVDPIIVESVTGNVVDNEDPENPVINVIEDRDFIFEQVEVSSDWIFEHPLERIVSIVTKDQNGVITEGEVLVNDGETVHIHFFEPIAGQAFLN